jgi:hypothetical protein
MWIFLNVFTEIITSTILVENEKVVAIIDFNFFTSEYVFYKNRYLYKNILLLNMFFFAKTAIYVKTFYL